MKVKSIILSLAFVLIVCGLTACTSTNTELPQAREVSFSARENAAPIFRIKDRDNVEDVIRFARSLSGAGRYKEAAQIYLDASKRFQSGSGHFEIDCKMSAVKEYWLAGELVKARDLLDQLEKEQDIYNRASESDEIRRLRTVLRESENLKNKVN